MPGLEAEDRHGPFGIEIFNMLRFVQDEVGKTDGQELLDIDPGGGVGGKDDPPPPGGRSSLPRPGP